MTDRKQAIPDPPEPKAAPDKAGIIAAAKADEAQTWIVFTDAKGKAHRVKSEDYKDGS